MIFRNEMLKKAGGVDQRYDFHHIYDRDLSLASLALGYKNVVLDVKSHHLSGLTANRPEYQNWISSKVGVDGGGDKITHDANSEIFREKWANYLPIYIEDDFSFRRGQQGTWDFKGDDIKNWRP